MTCDLDDFPGQDDEQRPEDDGEDGDGAEFHGLWSQFNLHRTFKNLVKERKTTKIKLLVDN